jgi:threonyl-tRNA synthetase
MLKAVGLDDAVSYRFSKWDKNNKEKYIGSEEEWENVQDAMRGILDDIGLDYTEADGEAAFYGPKLDIQIKNVFGKEDTLITIQIDFQLAKRFGMLYTDDDGEKKYPYVIHRTSLGCYERTLALVLEKYAGALPLWMAPVQARIMDISEKSEDYCREVYNKLMYAGIRPEKDLRPEKIGKKIRDARLEKLPVWITVGDKEVENGTVSVTSRREGDLGSMTQGEMLSKLLDDIAKKVR